MFFSFNAVNKLHVVLSKPPEKTHVVLETVFNLHRNCIQVFNKFLSETHAISESFWTGIWQKETPQTFGHHGKLRHIYSEIHLLAMPEICCFSLKTFKAVWVWKRSSQFVNWLGLFVAPWFIHQKSMQDSLKHF